MFGDIIIFIKTKWKQFWCEHDYEVITPWQVLNINPSSWYECK